MSDDRRDPPSMPAYATDYRVVLEAEAERIRREPKRGLAISGGGIRSASFGLGVLQALVRGKALTTIDYLSTVSGGGYIGSSLTWFLELGIPTGIDETTGEVEMATAGTTSKDFPFGKPRVGARLDAPSPQAMGGDTRNLVLDFIRQRAKYLTPGRGLNMVSLLGTAVRSMFVALAAYFALLTAALFPLQLRVLPRLELLSRMLPSWETDRLSVLDYFIPLALLIAALLAVTSVFFSLYTRFARRRSPAQYEWSVRDQKVIGFLWTLAGAVAVLGSLSYAREFLQSPLASVTAGGLATALGAILGFFEFRKEATKGAADSGIAGRMMSSLRIWIGSAAVIYGLLLLAFVAADAMARAAPNNLWVFPAVLLGALLLSVVTNLNFSGLHRMYRDRLMETFLPDPRNVVENRWGMATLADTRPLEELCDHGSTARPYHLINTNVVLIDSPTSKYRGRGGDSFLLSPLYCGSDATGWRQTEKYLRSSGYRGMTLASAMAISGAALNPNTGVAGGGVTRNRLVSALFSLLNLRLGYWAPSPSVDTPRPFTPNFLVPGVESALGKGHTERTWGGKQSRRIEITDGGHFDNLGLYELIRRKLELIIVSDAGADPEFRFGDLASVVERVRVDFGAKIRFREELDLTDMIPSPIAGLPADHQRYAERGYAVADIEYADETIGVLVYLKTTLTAHLPADIYGYRSANPAFPDQSTADQFFDEAQFEAYRELGYQLTKSMLKSEAGKKLFGGEWEG